MLREVDSDIDVLKAVDWTEDISSDVWKSLSKTIKACLLPEQSYGEERPAEEADFAHFRKEIVHGFGSVCDFICKLASTQQCQNFDRDSLVWTLILCGEHASTDLWTSEETLNFSAACVKALCSLYGCSSVSQLLLGQSPRTNSPCFKQALLLLRPKLLRETWQKHPGAVASYRWLLFQVRSPHLSDYVDVVSPTALIILDDHDVKRRLTGLHCLSHIIDNVARTELCRRGLHEVFYKTLEPMLWQRTASQVEPIMTCLTKLLRLTERGYTRSTAPGMWDLFDQTIDTLIMKMEFEDQIPLRLAYIKSLAPFLSAMGPSVIRWSKPLASLFDEYLTKESFDTRKYALQALQIYISLSTPRMSRNGDSCLFLLLRVLQDMTAQGNPEADPEVIQIIKNCIISIRQAAPSEFQPLCEHLENLPCNPFMKTILSECI